MQFQRCIYCCKRKYTVDKKTFTANDFEAPNNTAANATASNNANNNEFG